MSSSVILSCFVRRCKLRAASLRSIAAKSSPAKRSCDVVGMRRSSSMPGVFISTTTGSGGHGSAVMYIDICSITASSFSCFDI